MSREISIGKHKIAQEKKFVNFALRIMAEELNKGSALSGLKKIREYALKEAIEHLHKGKDCACLENSTENIENLMDTVY